MRENKKIINVGGVILGTSHVVIQSMTNTKTKNIDETVMQINSLEKAGCEIVRVAVTDELDALAIKEIKKKISIPIVADIHFDYRLALKAVASGADKIRINPGNIGSIKNLEQVVLACKNKKIPIRIGINSGSLEHDLLDLYHQSKKDALLESMKRAIEAITSFGFDDLVLSIKATDIKTTLEVNRELDKLYDYPLHIGLTEAGTIDAGTIRSSYTLGTLLNEGIGNTIRVSLNGDPVFEVKACKEILNMCGLYEKPTLIVCPTCGRCCYNIEKIAKEIEEFSDSIHKNIKIAIMGCVVNGPGEAKEADIGIAGGVNSCVLFKKGEVIKKYPDTEIINVLKSEILKMIEE